VAAAGEQFEFNVLGPLEVRRNGEALALGGVRQRSLLTMLLLHRNEVIPRERLIDALWGESPPATAVNALQVAVHGLRKLLGHDRLGSHYGGYELVVEPGELDLDEFERAADHARSGVATATELRRALSLWRGVAATDSYPDGVRSELARLDELRVFLLEERFEADLVVGRHAALVEELEALLAEHPYRERLRGQLIIALYRAGRQAEALEAYARARRTLVDDLGIEPGPELRELEARVLRQDPDLYPPAAAPALKGVGLPAPPTPLVGRRLELGAVAGFLRLPEVRLLTLTGIGGSGKTRVALAVAEELTGEYADGAHFVDLAPLAQPELVIGAIARALGVSETGGQTLLDSLSETLHDRETLLVTDNFEHVLAAAPAVAELLAAAPGLNVLATSRAPLRLAAEHEYPIRPLELPSQTHSPDPAALVQNEAVALFVARARAVRPDFDVTGENAAAVSAICAAVDGPAREAGSSEVTALAATGLGDVALARGAQERAGQWFRDALVIYEELGFPELQADTCVCLAAVANAVGEVEHAARLLGAAASLRQASGAPEQPNPAVLAYLNEVTAGAQAQLGDETFAAAFGRGRASPDDVVDERARTRTVKPGSPDPYRSSSLIAAEVSQYGAEREALSALRMSCPPSVSLARIATWPAAFTDTGFDANSATVEPSSGSPRARIRSATASGPAKRPRPPPRGVAMPTTAPALVIRAPRHASNAPSVSTIRVVRPSSTVKIPAPPVRSVAANATVPWSLTEGKSARVSKSSPVSTTVRTDPPRPA
jgi:DNA-binding SARP family transcriptional activator